MPVRSECNKGARISRGDGTPLPLCFDYYSTRNLQAKAVYQALEEKCTVHMNSWRGWCSKAIHYNGFTICNL